MCVCVCGGGGGGGGGGSVSTRRHCEWHSLLWYAVWSEYSLVEVSSSGTKWNIDTATACEQVF